MVVEEGEFDAANNRDHGYLSRGVGWYKRNISAALVVGASWLHFEGAYRDTHVYIDGILVAHHLSGYTPFNVPIGTAGAFQLTVCCNATLGEGWFYEGGGLYRPVHLIRTASKLHFVHDGIFASSQIAGEGIVCGEASCTAASAVVTAQAEVINSGAAATTFNVSCQVIAPNGNVVAMSTTATTLHGGGATTVRSALAVANVQLWSIDSPTLYTLGVTIMEVSATAAATAATAATAAAAPATMADAVNTTFGIRSVRWSADTGMLLNNQQVKLNGVCMHQDLGGLGVAVPDPLQSYRVHALKEMGANAWRCSHNPPNPALLAATDRLGMVVMVENRRFGPKVGRLAVQHLIRIYTCH
jgi:beta-galactosidase